MKKSHQTLFLLFVLFVCVMCVTLPLFSFEKDEIILFGLTLDEVQGYVYFSSFCIVLVLLAQYAYKLYSIDGKDGEDYEKYSNLALNDGETDLIEKI